mgnify:CR=1 FL=1
MRCSKLGWNKLKNGTVVEETSKNVYEWSFPIGSYWQSVAELFCVSNRVYHKYTFINSDKPTLLLHSIDYKYKYSTGFKNIYMKSATETVYETLELHNLIYENISSINVRKCGSTLSRNWQNMPIYRIMGLKFEKANINLFLEKYSKNRFTRKVTESQSVSTVHDVILPSGIGLESMEVFGPYEIYESLIEGLKFCLSQPIKT